MLTNDWKVNQPTVYITYKLQVVNINHHGDATDDCDLLVVVYLNVMIK